MRFSASRLKTWQDCQLKARYKYLDRLPDGPQNAKASFGTIMHHCLELFNQTGNGELAIDQFVDLWANPEKLGVAPEFWPKYISYKSLREKGIESLKLYISACNWDDRIVLGTEYEFVVPFGKHELHGFIDLLDIRFSGKGKDLLRITDYKSNGTKPNQAMLMLDIQFTVYVFATLQPEFWVNIPDGEKWFADLAGTERRAIWYQMFGGSEIDAGPRDLSDFERLYQLCDAIEKAHEQSVFVPRIGDACLFCPFTEQCGITIPTKEEVMAQESAWI